MIMLATFFAALSVIAAIAPEYLKVEKSEGIGVA